MLGEGENEKAFFPRHSREGEKCLDLALRVNPSLNPDRLLPPQE